MYKKAFKKTLIFLSILWVVLYFTEKTFDFFIKQNYDFKTSYISSGKLNVDILAQGNSRCLVMFDPNIIKQKTKYTAYNTGSSASDISYHLGCLMLYLKNNKKPKYLFLEVSPFYLTRFEKTYFPSSSFVPYLNDKDIFNIVKERNPTQANLSYMPFLKYTLDNDRLFNEVLKGAIQFIKDDSKEINYNKGYRPSNIKWDGQWDKYKIANPYGLQLEIDSTNLFKHIQYIKLAKMNGINLICYEAPILREAIAYSNNRDSVLAILDSVFNKYNVPYLKTGNVDGISDNKSLFYNSTHLNQNGAGIFTNYFCNYLLDNKIIERKN